MSTYHQRKKVVRELAKKLINTFAPEESYEETKETVESLIYETFSQNNAFIYFQPLVFEEFTLNPNQHLDITKFGIEDKETVELFKNIVAFFFKIRWEVITSSSRKREVVQARYLVIDWLLKNTSWSLTRVGHFIGGSDHSTVIHARQSVADLLDVDRPFINLHKNFNDLINVYTQSNIAGGLGETVRESGTGVAENRSVCSTEEN